MCFNKVTYNIIFIWSFIQKCPVKLNETLGFLSYSSQANDYFSLAIMNNSTDFTEFLKQLLRRKIASGFMLAGSVAELPLQYVLMNITDIDQMIFPLNSCALSPNDPRPKNFFGNCFIIETSEAYPGFARLRLVETRNIYLTGKDLLLKENATGPAVTDTYITGVDLKQSLSVDEINRYKRRLGGFEKATVDHVDCIFCPVWPTVAVEWIRRKRSNGWPTKKLIESVVKGGCHFVVKAHHSSPQDDTMFRFSFSYAEIVLVNSWSPVQKYIYHILRLMKGKVEKFCKEGGSQIAISSYTLKTLMLWSCEKKSSEFWNESSIETSVNELVCDLIEWLINGCCPNYFIPSNNMFDHPMDNVDLTVQMLSTSIYTEIPKLIASQPVANLGCFLSVSFSDKVLLCGQFGISQASNFIDPVNPERKENLMPDQLVAVGSEFSDLFRGMSANLRVAKNRFVYENQTKSYLEREAMAYYALAMTTNPQSLSKVVINLYKTVLDNFLDLKKAIHCDCNAHRSIVYVREATTKETEAGQRSQGCIPATTRHDVEKLLGIKLDLACLAVDRFSPKVSYFISAAYRVNFYFTYLENYRRCLELCKEVQDHCNALSQKAYVGEYFQTLCSLVLTSRWSAIFDRHIQMVTGFVLLYEHYAAKWRKRTMNSIREESNLIDNTFVIYISPTKFINYIENQCRRRLYSRRSSSEVWLDQLLESISLIMNATIKTNRPTGLLTTESQRNLKKYSLTVVRNLLTAAN